MKKLMRMAVSALSVPTALLCLSFATNAQAAIVDFTTDQQLAYQTIAKELNSVNETNYLPDDIEPNTYWVDSVNGVDEFSRNGQIDQPWKSILWAMNNVPFEDDEANIIVREGTYSPEVLYFSPERGGDSLKNSPFNVIAYPNERVVIDGINVGENGALISIVGAQKITLSGFELSNVQGSGKSVIYVSSGKDIKISNNTITNAKWTDDSDKAESPSLADRLNAIAILGESSTIMINNNVLNNLVTGYGEPIFVADTAQATLDSNTISDVDASSFEGQLYYVSPEGDDDSGVGSFDKPWKTIHKALFTVPFDEDDAKIIIRGGTYKIPTAMFFGAERGGSEGKYFTIKAYKDEEVIIDGSLLTAPFSAMASFSSTAYVRIKGLTFANLKGPKSGIFIEGNSHHIRIINNKLRDMTWADEATEDPLNPNPSDNLNPIAVIGNNPDQAIHNIVIRGNELADIVPGYSEGIKIVGNVTDFVVARNYIHDIANIGIVAAGNYPWVVDSSGTRIPDEVNHARNGVIRYNTVHNAVSPVANSAGIYLDGARNVIVRGNTSYNNAVGFSVGSEQAGDATGNVLRRNIAYDNSDAGLVVGTNPQHIGAVVRDTTIINNEFRNNYTKGGYGGELTIQSVEGINITNNLFSSRSEVVLVVSQPATGIKLDNNLYYTKSGNPDTAIFDWGGISGSSHIGFSAYQLATCNDLRSIYQDTETMNLISQLKKKRVKRQKKPKGKVLREIRRSCYSEKKVW